MFPFRRPIAGQNMTQQNDVNTRIHSTASHVTKLEMRTDSLCYRENVIYKWHSSSSIVLIGVNSPMTDAAEAVVAAAGAAAGFDCRCSSLRGQTNSEKSKKIKCRIERIRA
jgi:hypothetical protein